MSGEDISWERAEQLQRVKLRDTRRATQGDGLAERAGGLQRA